MKKVLGSRRLLLLAAALSGVLAGGCSSSSSGSESDAMADESSQEGDSAGKDASMRDATANRDAHADARPEKDARADGDAHETDALESGASDVGASDVGLSDDVVSDAETTDAAVSDVAASDAGTTDAAVSDAGSADVGTSDGGASDGSDGGPVAQLLVPGESVSVGGVTRDGYLIYYDGNTQTYYAQPLAGGPATTIYTAPLSLYAGYYTVMGNVALLWAWNSDYLGTLVAWSSGMAQGAPLTTDGLAYLYQTIWASEDSEHVAFLQSTSSNALVSALYVATPDGADKTLLLSNIDTNASFSGQAPSCFPRMVFRGDIAVVSYCAVGDGGVLSPQIQAFSISNDWASVAVVPNRVASLQYNSLDEAPFTFSFAVDPSGGQIAAASGSSGNGAVQIFPLDGGPGTVVDPSVQLTSSLSFTGSVTDPWSILYNNTAGALEQAYAANPTPQTLIGSGVHYFNALSDDGNWLLVSNALNNSGWFADLSLASTQSAGAPVLVASSAQYDGGPIATRAIYEGGKRGFTTDSAYALAETNLVELSASGRWVGAVRSMSVASPYTTKLLTNGQSVDYVAVHGSKVLLLDNYQEPDGGSPTVDLDVADPSSTGGTANIVRGVPGNCALSSDLTQIAYVVTAGTAPGIYVAPLP